jgi:hypothetical protein
VRAALNEANVAPKLPERVRAAEETADFGTFASASPAAFERAEGGVRRTGAIGGAMRELAHTPRDLDAALCGTLVVPTDE